MMDHLKEHKPNFTWEGRAICVTYIPDYLKSIGMAHVEIRCNEPLPITNTGYKSHFIHKALVEEYESPTDFVNQWLEHEAKKSSWTRSEAASPQLSLF